MFCCYLVSYYILFSGLLKHELHVAADLQIRTCNNLPYMEKLTVFLCHIDINNHYNLYSILINSVYAGYLCNTHYLKMTA